MLRLLTDWHNQTMQAFGCFMYLSCYQLRLTSGNHLVPKGWRGYDGTFDLGGLVDPPEKLTFARSWHYLAERLAPCFLVWSPKSQHG